MGKAQGAFTANSCHSVARRSVPGGLTMEWQTAIALLFASWGLGYVLGFKMRQIMDALGAI